MTTTSAEAFDMPMREAVAYLAQKVRTPTRRWTDLEGPAHTRAFAVAGVQADDLLAGIKAGLMKAVAEGTTLQEFRRDLEPMMERLGWRAKGRAYEAWRTRLVYQANLNTAYAAGRYAQMTDPDTLEALPFWIYRHSRKRDPRPQHVLWDGKVLAASDAWWKTHYPPNGWGCGCWAEAISRRDLRQMAKNGPDAAPQDGTRPWRDPVTDQVVQVPKGIDPGWQHNHGEGWLRGVVPPELREPLAPYAGNGLRPSGQRPPNLPPLSPARAADAPGLLPAGRDPAFYAEQFLEVFGATLERPRVIRDAAGARLVISRELFEDVQGRWKPDASARGPFMLRLAEALRDPDEIWADWAETEAGGVHVRRRYLRRFAEDGRNGLAVFEWTSKGWFGATVMLARKEDYLEKQRSGALLYQRQAQGEGGAPPPTRAPGADA
ncbi:MAG: hypothetical protein K5Q68_15005 [Roseococcus sp.]|nr:hypothetical protein [Roseococcus sp.]